MYNLGRRQGDGDQFRKEKGLLFHYQILNWIIYIPIFKQTFIILSNTIHNSKIIKLVDRFIINIVQLPAESFLFDYQIKTTLFIIMQGDQFQKQTLLKQQKQKISDLRSRDPAPLKPPMRPYKGIFLTFFLWFTGMLFFIHGFHRYEEYSLMDLIAVWVLSSLVIIPGAYFGCIIFAVEAKISGFSYKNHPQLYN